jgi:hypothetical protein
VREAFRWFPDGLPPDMLALDETALLRALGRPTLVRVPGTGGSAPRAISTLLHGDESTGLQAALRVLRRGTRHPFDLFWLIGNVEAALAPPGFGHRYLDGQADMNRIWDLDGPDTAKCAAAHGMLAILREAAPESLVDVHNNTGDNPFYAIVTRDHPATVNLATLMTTTLLRWELKVGTLMEALHDTTATCAIECGLPGRAPSLAFAVDALRRYLGDPGLVTDRYVRDADVYGRLRKVTLRERTRVRFGGELTDDLDLVLPVDGDTHNFVPVQGGHVIGLVHPGTQLPVAVHDPSGAEVSDEHLDVLDGRLVLSRAAVPVMMTRTEAAARKDCLFYLSEPIDSLGSAGPMMRAARPRAS